MLRHGPASQKGVLAIGRSFVRRHHSKFLELRVGESSYTGGFDAGHMLARPSLATARAEASTLVAWMVVPCSVPYSSRTSATALAPKSARFK